jgi:glycosidase
MTDIFKFWIDEFGIDGFRIDTAKHVNIEFWQEFLPQTLAKAAAAGEPDFYMFGEVFDPAPAYLSTFTTEALFPSVLDFGF